MNVNDMYAICMVGRVQGGGEVWKISAEREINIIEVIDNDKFDAMHCYNEMDRLMSF